MAASDEQVRAGVEAYVRLVGEGTAEEVVALFAEGATVEDPVGSEALSTREQLEEFYGGVCSMDRRTSLVEAKVVAGQAAFLFELVTTVGDATYTVRPVDVMTFDDDGRITSMRAFWGTDDMVAG